MNNPFLHRQKATAKPAKTRGFTLLEVMIALVVFAITAIALLFKSGQGITQSQYLEEKSYALWIAENTLTELRIKPEWPHLGEHSNEFTQFERQWSVQIDVSNTSEPSLRRINVQVSRVEDNKVLSNLLGYIGQY